MRKIMNYKTFEAKLIKDMPPILATSQEDLTNYYKCNKCNKDFYILNDTPEICSYCQSNDIKQISVFDYFADLKNGDVEIYKKELSLKRKRSDELIDLVSLGISKGTQKYKKNLN
jgi:hypothetical protein